MEPITKEDVTFVLKVGNIKHASDGAICNVDYVYRGDYGDHNWGHKETTSFGKADSNAVGFTALADVTKAQVSSWIMSNISIRPVIDTDIKMPSHLDNLQRSITAEINGFRANSVAETLTTATLNDPE